VDPRALALGLLGDRRRAVAHPQPAGPLQRPPPSPAPWRLSGRRPFGVSRSLPLRQRHGCRPPHQLGAVQVKRQPALQQLAVEGFAGSAAPATPTGSGRGSTARQVGCVHLRLPDANGTCRWPIPPEPTSQASSLTVSSKRLDAPAAAPTVPLSVQHHLISVRLTPFPSPAAWPPLSLPASHSDHSPPQNGVLTSHVRLDFPSLRRLASAHPCR